MTQEHYVVTCICGKTHRTRETEIRCTCGRLLEIQWRAEDVAVKPQPPTISERYER